MIDKKSMLEKMLMNGDKPEKGDMSKEQIQAKLDVLMEMMEMLQSEVGGSVKSGMDEMLAAMKPATSVEAEPLEQEVEMDEMGEEDEDEGYVEAKPEMKKVEVMASDDKGLEEGLDAAAKIAPKLDEMSEEDDSIFAKKKDKKKFAFLE